MSNLRSELLKVIDNDLSDWDKEGSFNRQAGHLADRLIEVMAEQCPARLIPKESVCFFKDGNSWLCVETDYVNLQESIVGSGLTFDEAYSDLQSRK